METMAKVSAGKPIKGKRFEQALEALREAAQSLRGDALIPHLRNALQSDNSLLVQRAVKLLGDFPAPALREELERAFDFFLHHPSEDKGCLAKEALAHRLLLSDDTDDALWMRAARHVQMEASFGDPIDAAAVLRGIAAMAVATSASPDKMDVLVDLLLDPEHATRAGTVRALGAAGSEAAMALVHYKLLLGDKASEVTAECLRAILLPEHITQARIGLAAKLLGGANDQLAEEAAIALGESRDERVIPVLVHALTRSVQAEIRGALLRALCLMRREEAYAALWEWLDDATPRMREEARMALAPFRGDAALTELFV